MLWNAITCYLEVRGAGWLYVNVYALHWRRRAVESCYSLRQLDKAMRRMACVSACRGWGDHSVVTVRMLWVIGLVRCELLRVIVVSDCSTGVTPRGELLHCCRDWIAWVLWLDVAIYWIIAGIWCTAAVIRCNGLLHYCSGWISRVAGLLSVNMPWVTAH